MTDHTSSDTRVPLGPDSDSFDQERELMHRKMLSSVSHDLKTPLASIIGSLEVFDRMKDKLTDEKKLSLIHVALHEAYRLDNFITNILDMAKLENGMVKVKPEEAEVGALISNCLLRLSNRLRDVTVDIVSSDPLIAMTDPVLLSRTVCLVLDNAVKYGGNPPQVEIDFGKDGHGMGYIGVRDNGPGVSVSPPESIFSKYTRFTKEDQQNAGTGLGLSIGRAIMNLLGGNLAVSTHTDGRTLFTMSFPLH